MTQLVTLLLDSKLVSVLCHFGNFGCGDGGWTPVMKMDGNKVKHVYFFPYFGNERGKESVIIRHRFAFVTERIKLTAKTVHEDPASCKRCISRKEI